MGNRRRVLREMRPRKFTPSILAQLEDVVRRRLLIPSDKELAELIGVSRFAISQQLARLRRNVEVVREAAVPKDKIVDVQPKFQKPAKPVNSQTKLCLRCAEVSDRWRDRAKGVYASVCRKCHAAECRENRVRYADLTPEQKFKANCRALTKHYLRRGEIARAPCEKCGDEKSQAHHEDYSKPKEVQWLCRICHMDLHRKRGDLNWKPPSDTFCQSSELSERLASSDTSGKCM